MNLLTEIKNKFAFWADLLGQRRTAAEQVVHGELSNLHKVLGALEARVVLITDETAHKLKAFIATIARDLTADEAKAKAELETAIGFTAEAATKLKAEIAAQGVQPAPATGPIVDSSPPAPEVPTPAVVEAAVEAAKVPEAQAAPVPVVDVTKSV